MDPVARKRSFPGRSVRQLRNIHTLIVDEVSTRMRKDNNYSMGMSARVVFLEHLNSVRGAVLRGSEVQIDERLRKGRVYSCRSAFDVFELAGAVEDKMGV